MLVQVTAEHIRKGIPRQSRECAIALAIVDMGYEFVRVTDKIRFCKGTREMQAPLPVCAAEFIRVFDHPGGQGMSTPFSCIIEPTEVP